MARLINFDWEYVSFKCILVLCPNVMNGLKCQKTKGKIEILVLVQLVKLFSRGDSLNACLSFQSLLLQLVSAFGIYIELFLLVHIRGSSIVYRIKNQESSILWLQPFLTSVNSQTLLISFYYMTKFLVEYISNWGAYTPQYWHVLLILAKFARIQASLFFKLNDSIWPH